LGVEKKMKVFLGSLIFFMVYMIVIGVMLVIALFTDAYTTTLKLLLYLGNVGSFGLSFYIMKQGRSLENKKLFRLGIIVMLINAYCILSFHIS
jgi:hypothetical protein